MRPSLLLVILGSVLHSVALIPRGDRPFPRGLNSPRHAKPFPASKPRPDNYPGPHHPDDRPPAHAREAPEDHHDGHHPYHPPAPPPAHPPAHAREAPESKARPHDGHHHHHGHPAKDD